MTEKVKILDAGGKVLFSGGNALEVEAEVSKYVERGSIIVTPVCKVGTEWVAVCTLPRDLHGLDSTQTLRLSDLEAEAAEKQTGEADDSCRIEELGFKLIVYGPTRIAVELRVAHLRHFGATLVQEIEELDGEWIAVCDTGGAGNTGYRW